MLAIVLLVVAFLVVSTAITVAAALLDEGLGNKPQGAAAAITPISLLAFNLSLAAQLPIAMLLQWQLFGVRPRWLSSVEGRFRWRWFGRLAVVLVPLYAVYIAFTFFIAPVGPLRLDGNSVLILLIVLITTPLQAAGEEYAMRGLVQRSISSWFRDGRVALIVSTGFAAVIFAVAHANADPWQMAYYVVFGVSASVATWGTGGLEAGILTHGVNNLFILAPLALSGGIGGIIVRDDEGNGARMLVPMTMVALSAVVCIWLARRSHNVTRSARPMAEQPNGQV
ncbi:membrane protease YdiL (CAAX protease family) [Cryobacterium sp. MP_M3]|uniref:CPBP family intramembrane glutamic endopeptidase n=1 Tax=unclassified Cryobacterium TaxID=2649013 RepID=UPI0018C94011|nr:MULTISPECIES: CPBP family intramembrane glutamic endopeptidase [unclassified Cryobacterium]MBG6060154.1 membrane protease YdiL (CAAX protease family) [Cryobacterium sp. MP_M3]